MFHGNGGSTISHAISNNNYNINNNNSIMKTSQNLNITFSNAG